MPRRAFSVRLARRQIRLPGEAVPDTAAPEGSKLETIELAIEGDDLFYLHIPKKSPWALE